MHANLAGSIPSTLGQEAPSARRGRAGGYCRFQEKSASRHGNAPVVMLCGIVDQACTDRAKRGVALIAASQSQNTRGKHLEFSVNSLFILGEIRYVC